MITAHSSLSEKYFRRSSMVENSLLFASVVLNALVFADATFITRITGLSEDFQRTVTGAVSVVIFAISAVLLQVRWKEKAKNHKRSAHQLFSLLQECRKIILLPEGLEKEQEATNFNSKYIQISEIIEPIPNKVFNFYKSLHRRKLELSKLIDKHPGSFLFLLKIRLFITSLKSNGK